VGCTYFKDRLLTMPGQGDVLGSTKKAARKNKDKTIQSESTALLAESSSDQQKSPTEEFLAELRRKEKQNAEYRGGEQESFKTGKGLKKNTKKGWL
jgi:hypothetical protein